MYDILDFEYGPTLGRSEGKMDLLINVLLVASGFVGAVMAIGGKTWVETNVPLHKRITPRGWIAGSCLVVTLILGIVKEVRTSSAAASLRTQVTDANARLEESRRLLRANVLATPPS